MKCQKCGAVIPEGKIYCENCGTAIQMVPDYNPADDITIGTEENSRTSEKLSGDSLKKSEAPGDTRHRRNYWKYSMTAVFLVIFGFVVFQISYQTVLKSQEILTEPEESVILLSKPQFSVRPGTYDYSPLVTLSHAQRNEGIIYYTTDGTTPTEESHIYNSPIEMGEGTTVLRAIFLRSDGMRSEEAEGIYEVAFDYPAEPVFSMEAGTYSGSFKVSLTAEPDCKIYYTTNGEEPGADSKLYRGPITVLPGLTVLQAVAIDAEGGMSGIVEAIYNVE